MNSSPAKTGFTLIEIMIAMALTVTMVTIGAVRYNNFNKIQTVQTAGLTLKNNLREIQGKAQANLKPAACGVTALESYRVQDIPYNTDPGNCGSQLACLRAQAFCGSLRGPVNYYKLPPNFDFYSSPADIDFKILSLGTNVGVNGETIIIRGFRNEAQSNRYYYKLCVSTTGEIKDCGYKKGVFSNGAFPCNC